MTNSKTETGLRRHLFYTPMDTLGIIAIILAAAGILGGILPVIPGPPLSALAMLCVYFSDKADEVSPGALAVWIALAVILTILDYIIPGKLTKLTGGHKAAERGATIGLIAGIFLTPIGMILGCFLGAFIGEMTTGASDSMKAIKAASGAFLGFILSTGMKVIFSVILLWQVLIHLF